jgi:hypothetical protein
VQGSEGRPERLGRLQLRYIEMQYQDTTDFYVEVTPKGRSTYTYSVAQAVPRDGNLRFPVLGRGEDTVIEIVQATPGGCRVIGFDWEGFFKARGRRL